MASVRNGFKTLFAAMQQSRKRWWSLARSWRVWVAITIATAVALARNARWSRKPSADRSLVPARKVMNDETRRGWWCEIYTREDRERDSRWRY